MRSRRPSRCGTPPSRLSVGGVFLGAILASTALADDAALHVLPLSNRDADEIAPLIAPLMDADEGVVAASDRLLLRARSDTLAAVKDMLPALDRRRASLLMRMRLLSSSATATSGGLDSVEVRLGNERSPARALIVGSSDQRSARRSESVARVLEGGEAWVTVQDVELVDANRPPLLALQVRPPPPRRGGGARIDLVQAPATPLLRATGSTLRIVPRLRRDEVVAQISAYGSSPGVSVGVSTAGYSGEVVAPLGQWISLAAVVQTGHFDVPAPGYPGATAEDHHHELWVKFEQLP